jgi:hypothetical protein
VPQLLIIGGGPRRVFTAIRPQLASAASFAFPGTLLGDALPNRQIVVGAATVATGTNFAITGITVGGAAATAVVDRAQTDSILKCRAALYRIANAADASASIVVSLAGSVAQCQIGVWALYDLSNAAPAFTANDGRIDGNTAAVGINVPAAGLLLSLGVVSGGLTAQTLSGLATIDASEATTQRQWGSYQAAGAESGRPLSFSGSGAADMPRALVAASWS